MYAWSRSHNYHRRISVICLVYCELTSWHGHEICRKTHLSYLGIKYFGILSTRIEYEYGFFERRNGHIKKLYITPQVVNYFQMLHCSEHTLLDNNAPRVLLLLHLLPLLFQWPPHVRVLYSYHLVFHTMLLPGFRVLHLDVVTMVVVLLY